MGCLSDKCETITGDKIQCGDCSGTVQPQFLILPPPCSDPSLISTHPKSGAKAAVPVSYQFLVSTFSDSLSGILNAHSSVVQIAGTENKYTWKCEFCGNDNKITLEEGEKPTTEFAEYVHQPAPVSDEKVRTNFSEKAKIIYCIDISGSMGTTTTITGKLDFPEPILKGEHKPAVPLFFLVPDHLSLRFLAPCCVDLPHHEVFSGTLNFSFFAILTFWCLEPSIQHGNVSRLQCIKAAVHTHLEHVAKNLPYAKPSLITFSNEVNVYGDGTNRKPTVLKGRTLNNLDDLLKTVSITLSNPLMSLLTSENCSACSLFSTSNHLILLLLDGLTMDWHQARLHPSNFFFFCLYFWSFQFSNFFF